MTDSKAAFRVSFTLEELRLIFSLVSSDPELLMEQMSLAGKLDKAIKKAEFGLTVPAFTTSGTARGTAARIGTLTLELLGARGQQLLERKEAGEILDEKELEELVQWKADQKMPLDENEQQVFNKILMKQMGL